MCLVILNLALNMASRCMLNVTTAIKWVHTMEVFPTRVRSFGFAASFTFGRIGGILAPFTRDLVSGPRDVTSSGEGCIEIWGPWGVVVYPS